MLGKVDMVNFQILDFLASIASLINLKQLSHVFLRLNDSGWLIFLVLTDYQTVNNQFTFSNFTSLLHDIVLTGLTFASFQELFSSLTFTDCEILRQQDVRLCGHCDPGESFYCVTKFYHSLLFSNDYLALTI